MKIQSKDQMDLYKARPVFKIPTLKKTLQELQIACSARKGRFLEVITGEDLVEVRSMMRRHGLQQIPFHFKREKNLVLYAGSGLPWPQKDAVLTNLTAPDFNVSPLSQGFNDILTAILIDDNDKDVFEFSTQANNKAKFMLCHGYETTFLNFANNFFVRASFQVEEAIIERLLPAIKKLISIVPNVTKEGKCYDVKIKLLDLSILADHPLTGARDLVQLANLRKDFGEFLDKSSTLRDQVEQIAKVMSKTEDQSLEVIAFGTLMAYMTNLGYNKKTILIVANAWGFISSLIFISWCVIKRLCFKQRRHWIKAKKSELGTVLFGPAPTSRGSTPSPPVRKRRAMRRSEELEQLALEHRPHPSVDRIIEAID
jgi:hypothetical protein